MTATTTTFPQRIAWTDDEPPRGRYLLDRSSFLGPILLLPAVIYILALVGIPFVLAIAYAFSDATVGDQSLDWVGLQNFRDIWGDATFQTALRNTFVFTFVSQAVVIVLSSILALVLDSDFHGKRLVRFLVLLPWTTPIALAVIGWLWTLDSVYSPIDAILRDLGLLGPGTHWGPGKSMLWLAKPELAKFSVVMIHIWRTTPLAAVIVLAGLAGIPKELNEAASIDGASEIRQIFLVRIPLLLPILMVAILYGIIFTFTDMAVVYILTRGGPMDQTQVLASWAFFKGVEGTNLAQGAAIALFLFPVLVAAAVIMLRMARRTETV